MEAFEQPEIGALEHEIPPEGPPPFEVQLAYSQMAAELDPTEDVKLDTAEAQEHLQEVMVAAEQGESIEGDLERSHEIKDEQPSPSPLASSVGQILAQIHEQTQATHSAYGQGGFVGVSSSPKGNLQLPIIGKLSPMYQRALLGGLAGGLVIIAILAFLTIGPLSR